MNVLKGIGVFFISVIMILLLEAFSLSLSLKYVLQNQIIGGVVKEQVVNDYLKNNKITEDEKVDKLINDNRTNDIINNVIDDYMEYLDDSSYQVSDKTIDSIIDYCVKHKDEISEIAGREVKEEEIKSTETRNNIKKALNEGFDELGKDLGSTEKTIIKTYGNFTSKTFRIVLIIIFFVQIGLLMLIKWSPYKWLSTTGIAFIISSIFISILYAIARLLLSKIVVNQTKEFSINPKIMLIIGIVEFVVGLVFVITKAILDKKFNPKEEVA